MRSCSGCTLCCRLLPMRNDDARVFRIRDVIPKMIEAGWAKPEEFRGMLPDFDKPAGARCPHQRHGKGCAVYAQRPFGCRMWSCRWLADPEATANLSRPDRAGYVIDPMPDFITLEDADGTQVNVEVIQIWVDPKRPDAHQDSHLRAYLERESKVALIRFNESDGFSLWPPSLSSDGQWHELHGASIRREHEAAERITALAGAQQVILR